MSKKNKNEGAESNQQEDESGTNGGSTGEIRFHYQDPLSTPVRDDLLSPEERKRLLAAHKELHQGRVDKQRTTLKDRKLLKEKGQAAVIQARLGRGGGHGIGSSPYKPHPISQKPQFSGIDKQVTAIPTENMAETNEEQRNELENRYQHKLGYQHTKKFNPKPRPY